MQHIVNDCYLANSISTLLVHLGYDYDTKEGIILSWELINESVRRQRVHSKRLLRKNHLNTCRLQYNDERD